MNKSTIAYQKKNFLQASRLALAFAEKSYLKIYFHVSFPAQMILWRSSSSDRLGRFQNRTGIQRPLPQVPGTPLLQKQIYPTHHPYRPLPLLLVAHPPPLALLPLAPPPPAPP